MIKAFQLNLCVALMARSAHSLISRQNFLYGGRRAHPLSSTTGFIPEKSGAVTAELKGFERKRNRFEVLCKDFARAVSTKQILSTHVPVLQPGDLVTMMKPGKSAKQLLEGYVASDNGDETFTVHSADGSVHNNVPAALLQHVDKENGYTRLHLPNQVEWPTFFSGFQWTAMSPALYLRRDTVTDRNHRTATLKSLRTRMMSVVWLGIAGIGKSIDFNDVLLKCLENLGEQDWFDYAIYHIEGKGLVVFSRGVHETEPIVVEGFDCKPSDSAEILRRYPVERTVLLNELGEHPKYLNLSYVPAGMPMLITLPTCNEFDFVETMERYGVKKYYYVDIPSDKMTSMMLRDIVTFASANELYDDHTDLNVNASIAEQRTALLQTFQERQSVDGPILRRILHSYPHWSRWALHPFIGEWSMWNIPQQVEERAAPYLRPEVLIPDLNMDYTAACTDPATPLPARRTPSEDYKRIYQLRLHSDHFAKGLRNHVSAIDELSRLTPKDGNFQLIESYARNAQRADSTELKEWIWFADGGKPRRKARKIEQVQLPQWSQEYRHPDPALAVAADKLDGQGLYVPHHNNNPVYHHLSIRHPEIDAEGKVVKMGTVYLVHCSSIHNQAQGYIHEFDEDGLVNVLNGLKLRKKCAGCGGRYEVILVGMTYKGAPKVHGMVIRANGNTMSVAQWANSKRAQRYSSVRSVLVRAPVFPRLDTGRLEHW